MPTVIEAVKLSEGYLQKHGVESARLSAEHLLAKVLGCSRLDLYLRFEEVLDEPVLEKYRGDLKKRAGHYPLQYLLGEVDFLDLSFRVREEVFIPRPETELLVEWIEEELGEKEDVRFFELGVGTGIISGTLASRHSGWTGIAVDLSRDAVSLAKENLDRHSVSGRVLAMAGDGFGPVAKNRAFHLVVSNPPYIPSGEIDVLQKEVACHESRTALEGGEDGLDFYPVLAAGGKEILLPGGMIFVEIGHGQASGVIRIFEDEGYECVRMKKDYNGLERMVAGRRPPRDEGVS